MSPEQRANFVNQRDAKSKRRDELIAQNDELMAASGGEAIDADKRAKFEAGLKEATALRKDIEALNARLEDAPREDTPEVMEALRADGYNPKETPFRRWIAGRMDAGEGLSQAERKEYIGEGGFNMSLLMRDTARREAARIEVAEGMKLISKEQADIKRAQLADELVRFGAFDTPSDGSGVPTTTQGFLTLGLQSFKGIRPKATVIQTPTGSDLEYPVYSDTDRTGEFRAEDNSSNTSTDDGNTVATVKLEGHALSSKMFVVSRKLMLNASYNVEEFVRGQLMRSLAKAENAAFSSGSGASSNQPQGYQGLATEFNAANATSFSYAELVRFMHSLDLAYRYADGEGMGGVNNTIGGKGACWVMHDSAIGYIRGLEDSDGRQLWEKDYKLGAPDTLFGFPVQIDQNAPALGSTGVPRTGINHVFFGDFSYYVIRDSGPMSMDLVLDFDRVGKNNVGMLLWAYRDGNVVSPRSNNKVDVIRALHQG